MNNLPSVADIKLNEKVLEVLVTGNLKNLSASQKVEYYNAVCSSLGLNPLTKPFAYFEVQGREVLGINKGGCEQLRKLYSISVVELNSSQSGDLYTVTCKVATPDGRTDQGTGAVDLKGLTGKALSNAIMTCETKAKNRATQSICSLGMLDYTEIEDARHRRSEGAKALNIALSGTNGVTAGHHEPLEVTAHLYDLERVPEDRRNQAEKYAADNGAKFDLEKLLWRSPTPLDRLSKYEIIDSSMDLTEG